MEELISIIVPIYNVENYLEKCIDSILKQTYKNLEVILVDDGSPDESGSICDKYKEQDNRIVVIHKTNGGLSSARNAGLEIARGNYIGFCDSDDYLECDMLEKLYHVSKSNNADIVICDFNSVSEDGEIYNKNENIDKPGHCYTISRDDAQLIYFKTPEKRLRYVVMWNKLYKRECFDNKRLPEGKLHEDEFVTYKLLYEAKKIVYLQEKLYNYLNRKGSIMDLAIKGNRFHIFEAYMERLLFYIEKDELEFCKKMIFHYIHMLCQYKNWSQNVPSKNSMELELYRSNIVKFLRTHKFNFSIYQKVELLLFKNINLYYKIWKLKRG